MSAHLRTGMLLALLLSGCASHVPKEAPQPTQRIDSVDQRMLETGFGAAPGAAAVQSYRMQPQEVFRMPQPLQAPTPQLPSASPRRTLAPTTVCVRVILSAQGMVERSALLNDRPDCSAGAQLEMADLLQAVQDAVAQWRSGVSCRRRSAPMPIRRSGRRRTDAATMRSRCRRCR